MIYSYLELEVHRIILRNYRALLRQAVLLVRRGIELKLRIEVGQLACAEGCVQNQDGLDGLGHKYPVLCHTLKLTFGDHAER